MIIRTSHTIATGFVSSLLVAGTAAIALSGGASAMVADGPSHRVATPPTVAAPAPDSDSDSDSDDPMAEPVAGLASMSSPYIPGVWHVPADVLLTVGPDGTAYVGPQGSFFNGPSDVVDARVDAWFDEQLAAGLTPEQADRKLARLGR